MTYTNSMVAITDAVKAKLDADIASMTPVIGLKATYYGMESLIPDFPAACVESDAKDRAIVTTHQFEPTLRTAITVIYGKVGDTMINTRESEVIAEKVEAVLHGDYSLGGLVYFGFVSRITPGTLIRPGVVLRATRLLWVGRSREGF